MRKCTRNMTAKLKYLKDCYMENEIYYYFILYGNSKVSYKEKYIKLLNFPCWIWLPNAA